MPEFKDLTVDPMALALLNAQGGSTVWGIYRQADSFECRLSVLLPPDTANLGGAEFCLQCEEFHIWPEAIGA